MRRKVVAGNWKMNMTPTQAKVLVKSLADEVKGAEAEVIYCVPAIDITTVADAIRSTDVKLGAENMYYEEKGAYTGEISPEMLVDAGVQYIIIGHSERRQLFNEDDTVVNKKVLKALEHNLTPIICCGETLEQREAGVALPFIEGQIKAALEGVTAEQIKKSLIAYEPIWAIGTGKVATTEQAQEVCAAIRGVLGNIYDKETAEEVHILYGGSVKPDNAKAIFEQPDIDGGLVGGASLTLDFAKIVNYK